MLWTVIAILIGVYFFLRRQSKPANASPRVTALHPQPSQTKKESDKFVLVTLNETLISSDTLELIPGNVSSFRQLAEQADKKTGGLIVVFTIGEKETDTTPSLVEKRLDEAGIMGVFLKPHRIVFTQSVEGRVSVGRQIEACTFLDPDDDVVSQLTGKVPEVCKVDPVGFKDFVKNNARFSTS